MISKADYKNACAEVDYNHPESKQFAERLAENAKFTTIELGEDDVLYIHCNLEGRSYPQATVHKIVEHVKATFEECLPDAKIIVGFQDLQFTVISKKHAFNEKLKGTVK